MKKFTARFVSFIVVALMFTTLIPVAAFAADGAGVTTTAYSQFYPNTNTYNSVATNGLAQNGYGTVVLTGDVTTATDLVYTKYYTNHGHGSPKGFTWMLVEQNTNPDVATATVSQGTTIDGKPCIKVDFEKGSVEGTTQIVIGFTVTELSMESGIAQDSDTYMYVYGYLYYNVTNDPGEESSSSSEDSSSSSSEETSSSSSEDSSSSSSSEESSSSSDSGSGSGSGSNSGSSSQSGLGPISRPDSDGDSNSNADDGSASVSSSSSKDIPDTGAGSSTGATVALAGLTAVMVAALAVVGKKHRK